jgi:cell shape-determining protein MreC
MSGLSTLTELYNQQIKEAEARVKSGESSKRMYTHSRKDIWAKSSRRPKKTPSENINSEKRDTSLFY